MTTFGFSLVDEGSGTKTTVSYEVTDEEGKRMLGCFYDCAKCKDPAVAFQAMAEQMLQALTNHACAYECAKASVPIVPKQD